MACVSQYAPLAGSQRKALRIPAVALFAPAMDMVTFSVAFLFCKATKIMCATSSRLTLEASMWLAPCVRTTTLSLLLFFLLFARRCSCYSSYYCYYCRRYFSRRRYYYQFLPNLSSSPAERSYTTSFSTISFRRSRRTPLESPTPEQLKLNRHR